MAQPPAPQPPTQQPPVMQPGYPPPTAVVDGPAPGVKFAGFAQRLVGYLIDGVVVGVLVWVVIIVLGIIVGVMGSAGADALAGISALIMVIAVLGISILYFPYFWQKSGQTPGMRVMRIKVVRDADGGPISWGPALIRLVGFWISSFVFYIGFLWVFVDKRRRGWFDLMAGTCVVEV
jgi:uncharacterized RDD family membrane protein YckC